MLSQTSFTLDDENFLLKQKKKQLNLILLLVFATLFSLGVVYFVYRYQGYITYNLYWKFSVAELLGGFLIILMLSKPYRNLKKDLEDKIKNVYAGKIIDKKEETGENSSTYYLSLEEDKFVVSKEWYEQFNVNDEIVLEQSTQSKVVLNINKKI